MNIDLIKPRLRELHPTNARHDYWEVQLDLEENCEWQLGLGDPEIDSGMECGHIAIFHTQDHRWAITVLFDPDVIPAWMEPDNPIYVCDSLQDAKRTVDHWLGSPSPELPGPALS
jgi:hypothetical protein